MKKTTFFICLLLVLATLISCGNGDSAETETPGTTQSAEKPIETVSDTEANETTEPQETTPVETTEPLEILPEPPEYENIALVFDSKQLCVSSVHPILEEGTLISYASWSSTDYIDVSGFAGMEYELAAYSLFNSVSFYDSEKQYISGIGTNSMIGSATSVMGITEIPENAKYARFIRYNGSSNVDMPAYDDSFVHLYKTEDELSDALKLRKHNDLVIACLGDSLTEGDYGTTENKTNRHYKNYPYYLSKALGCKTVNFGMCGANSESFYKTCYVGDRVDITNADVILIMLGTNRGLDGDYETFYVKLINAIKEDMKEGAKIILITPPHVTTDANKAHYGWHPNVVSATNKVKELSESLGIPMINAYAMSPIQAHTEYKYQPIDGLHLSESGYRVFANYIAEEVKRLLELK